MNVNKIKCLADITPFSLLDFETKSSCILWFSGCSLRCSYCYNPEIVLGKAQYNFDYVLDFLSKRKGLLDAVVFSGGECTNHKNIISYATQIKNLGFQIKIDTNGVNPEVIVNLSKNNLIDFVALDFKSPSHKYKSITQTNGYSQWLNTFNFLLYRNIPFEVRTTYHQQMLSYSDIEEMNRFLHNSGYQGKHYIQNFVNHVNTLGNLSFSHAFSIDKIGAELPIEIVIRN